MLPSSSDSNQHRRHKSFPLPSPSASRKKDVSVTLRASGGGNLSWSSFIEHHIGSHTMNKLSTESQSNGDAKYEGAKGSQGSLKNKRRMTIQTHQLQSLSPRPINSSLRKSRSFDAGVIARPRSSNRSVFTSRSANNYVGSQHRAYEFDRSVHSQEDDLLEYSSSPESLQIYEEIGCNMVSPAESMRRRLLPAFSDGSDNAQIAGGVQSSVQYSCSSANSSRRGLLSDCSNKCVHRSNIGRSPAHTPTSTFIDGADKENGGSFSVYGGSGGSKGKVESVVSAFDGRDSDGKNESENVSQREDCTVIAKYPSSSLESSLGISTLNAYNVDSHYFKPGVIRPRVGGRVDRVMPSCQDDAGILGRLQQLSLENDRGSFEDFEISITSALSGNFAQSPASRILAKSLMSSTAESSTPFSVSSISDAYSPRSINDSDSETERTKGGNEVSPPSEDSHEVEGILHLKENNVSGDGDDEEYVPSADDRSSDSEESHFEEEGDDVLVYQFSKLFTAKADKIQSEKGTDSVKTNGTQGSVDLSKFDQNYDVEEWEGSDDSTVTDESSLVSMDSLESSIGNRNASHLDEGNHTIIDLEATLIGSGEFDDGSVISVVALDDSPSIKADENVVHHIDNESKNDRNTGTVENRERILFLPKSLQHYKIKSDSLMECDQQNGGHCNKKSSKNHVDVTCPSLRVPVPPSDIASTPRLDKHNPLVKKEGHHIATTLAGSVDVKVRNATKINIFDGVKVNVASKSMRKPIGGSMPSTIQEGKPATLPSHPHAPKFKWKLGTQIGMGSFGIVHLGINKTTGILMAVKSICINGSSSPDRICGSTSNRKARSEALLEFQREIDVMQQLSHPNIVRYLGADIITNCDLSDSSSTSDGSRRAASNRRRRHTERTTLYIFQQWVPGGSLSGLIRKFGPLSVSVIRRYLHQILSGLEYLHRNHIIHRDIKGGNILVDDRGCVKLADFGAAKQLVVINQAKQNAGLGDARSDEGFDSTDDNNYMCMTATLRGTPYFMAPEVYIERYNNKCDIWSVGGVAYQMATGNPPWKVFGYKNPMALFWHLQNSQGPPPPFDKRGTSTSTLKDDDMSSVATELFPESFYNLLEMCFRREPVERESARSLLQHVFFDDTVSLGDDDQSHHSSFRSSIIQGANANASVSIVETRAAFSTGSGESSSGASSNPVLSSVDSLTFSSTMYRPKAPPSDSAGLASIASTDDSKFVGNPSNGEIGKDAQTSARRGSVKKNIVSSLHKNLISGQTSNSSCSEFRQGDSWDKSKSHQYRNDLVFAVCVESVPNMIHPSPENSRTESVISPLSASSAFVGKSSNYVPKVQKVDTSDWPEWAKRRLRVGKNLQNASSMARKSSVGTPARAPVPHGPGYDKRKATIQRAIRPQGGGGKNPYRRAQSEQENKSK